VNQPKLKPITCSRHKERGKVYEQVAVGFGFISDWMRKWRKIVKPITKRSNVKPKQMQSNFDTQVKSALRLRKIKIDYNSLTLVPLEQQQKSG